MSRNLIPATFFHYQHDPRGKHYPRAFRVRPNVSGEIVVRGEIAKRYGGLHEVDSFALDRLRAQAEELLAAGVLSVDLGRLDKAEMREKAKISPRFATAVAFDQAWAKLVESGYLSEDGEIQEAFHLVHKNTFFNTPSWSFDLLDQMQQRKRFVLDVDKLRTLPPDHPVFMSFNLRKSDLARSSEEGCQAYVEAIVGRFAADLGEVAEFIPTAENFYTLAGYFLKQHIRHSKYRDDEGEAERDRYLHLAEECFKEAEKYDSSPGWRAQCEAFIRANVKMAQQAGELLFLMLDILSRQLALDDLSAMAAFDRITNDYLEEIFKSICHFSQTAINIPGIGSGSVAEGDDEDVITVQFSLRVAAAYAENLAELFTNLDRIIEFIRQLRENRIIERPYLLAFLKLAGSGGRAEQLADLIRIELTLRAKAMIVPLRVLANNPPCPEGHLVDTYTTGLIDQPVPLAEFLSTDTADRLTETFIDSLLRAFGCHWADPSKVDPGLGGPIGFTLEDQKMVIQFFAFLAEHQVQPWAYINALLLLGKRFPEYQKRLAEILEQEKANILDPSHAVRPAAVPAELIIGLELPPQPVPLIEKQLAERALPEEIAGCALPDVWQTAESHLNLADRLVAAGRADIARDHVQAALRLKPANPGIDWKKQLVLFWGRQHDIQSPVYEMTPDMGEFSYHFNNLCYEIIRITTGQATTPGRFILGNSPNYVVPLTFIV
ncbi:MAG: hypothetical protein ABH823_04050, partial [bacterium]